MPVLTPEQYVTVHTARGTTIFQFAPTGYTSLAWTRKQRDAGTLDLALPYSQLDRLPEVAPWVHWCSVWDGERDLALWTGPIQKVSEGTRSGMRVSAKDHAAYLPRTRTPMSKRWEAADPAEIAAELWSAMIELQGIRSADPIIRHDRFGYRYDFATVADGKMLDQTLSDLVNLGLVWTVVAGRPLLGPLHRTPVQTLSEDHFIGNDAVTLVRDGSATYNDVLVKVKDAVSQARIDYYGQRLQTIKTLDSLGGISNAIRAAESYVQQTGIVKTRLDLGDSTTLHPDAPVTIDELVPSARFLLEARGVLQRMQLTSMEAACSAGAATVKVTMISDVEDPPELDNLRKTNTTDTTASAS